MPRSYFYKSKVIAVKYYKAKGRPVIKLKIPKAEVTKWLNINLQDSFGNSVTITSLLNKTNEIEYDS